VLFDTLCAFFPLFFKFLVFEAAIYANKDVFITQFLKPKLYKGAIHDTQNASTAFCIRLDENKKCF